MGRKPGAPVVRSANGCTPAVRRIAVELCVDDVDGALVADRSGADRIELCANLGEGGTTPSMGAVLAVLRAVNRVGVQVIVRPRGGDFVYSDAELETMCRDLEAIEAAASGAGTPVGVVTGVLTSDGEVDVSAMRRLMAAAGTLPVTFHKAFDLARDPLKAYQELTQLGVQRVLTSGGPHPAAEGIGMLAELVRLSKAAPSAPSVLVGGSVRPANVREIVAATGAGEIHLRAQTPSPRMDGTLQTDPDMVRSLFAALESAAADDPPSAPRHDAVVLAVDVGGTNIKGALVAASGRTLLSRTVPAGVTGDESIERILALAEDLRDYAEDDGCVVAGAGVVTPGMVDSQKGIIRYASSLGWSNVPLKRLLTERLGVPVHIDHDVRTSGLAEDLFGASHGSGDSVLVAVGTGVAASIQSGGHRISGASATAGELGHIPVIPDGERCTCGQFGCLEAYFSGAGVARRFAASGGEAGLDVSGIVARLGIDPLADRVWSEGITALALGLKTLTLLTDPAVIVLTGGVSRAGSALLDPLLRELSGSLAWRDAPDLRLSMLGTSGSRIGAAVLAFRAAGMDNVVSRWTTEDVLMPVSSAS
nr:copper homeostasis protein CutC [Arthrobacter sp. zg-Y20]